MKQKIILPFLVLVLICTSALAQKAKTVAKKPTTSTGALSTAEKMGYVRTNKYWGPGTFYLYAPGKSNNKMANTPESAMRDLTGLMDEDFYKELEKQGFVEVPKKEALKTWFNNSKNKDKKYYYSPDKSYILEPAIKDMWRSPKMESGKLAFVTHSMTRWILIPKEDSLKVEEAIWQYLRDLREMKVLLSTFGSNFKKADPKAFPIQRVGTAGWNGLRAGSWALTMEGGKPMGHWERNEDIIRRTIGMPEFHLEVLGVEADYNYYMNVKLLKEGYVLEYAAIALNFGDLEPGNTWVKQYPIDLKNYLAGEKMDIDNIATFKKAPLPPVLGDLNKLLHIK